VPTPTDIAKEWVSAYVEGRVLVEGTVDGVPVVAVLVVRDDRMAAVSTYVSDREMLERLGLI